MIRFLMAMAVVIWGGTAVAQSADADIEAVISNQMEAFKADDFAEAFTYASPMIQRLFGTSERFGAMVQQGYPMVHRPADIQFLAVEDFGNVKRQKVMVRDAGGVFHVLDYEMIQTPDGWQINGVQLLETRQLGA